MEAIVPLILIGGMAFFAYRVFAYFRLQSRWNRAYVAVGQRYLGKAPNGGVTYGMMFSRPTLSFPYRNTQCMVRSRRSKTWDTRYETRVFVRVQADLPRFEATTGEFTRSRYRRDPGTHMKSIDPLLRDHFRIATQEPSRFEKHCTSAVAWQLEQLRRLTGWEQVSVAIKRGNLVVSKPGFIADFQMLDDLVRFTLELHDQLLLASAQGIDFVNDNSAAIFDQVKCPICSEEIVHDLVVCTRCKTPHCRDCWQYNGQCATFACNETRFLQVGGPAQEASSPRESS